MRTKQLLTLSLAVLIGITPDVQDGTTLENGFLWSVDFSSTFPTATQEELGSEQWALIPGFQLGRVTAKFVFGVFANHQ